MDVRTLNASHAGSEGRLKQQNSVAVQKIENMAPLLPEQPLVTVVCQVLTVALSERVWSFSGECRRVWARRES